MRCPRCSADNDDARAACWSCFAQLQPPAGSKPQTIQSSKPQPVPAMPARQEPAPTPAPEPVAAQPPQLVEEEPEPAVSKALDLGEPVAESGYFVPGLAEQVESLAVTPADEETEAPAARVLDLDAFEEELKAPSEPEPEKGEDEA